jgi:limonene-1,2-epoxide hydrolase
MNQDLEQKVRQFLALFNDEVIDFDQIGAFFAPDAEYRAHVPSVKPLRGRGVIRSELERQLQLYDECDFQIQSISSNATQVFTERQDYVTQTGNGHRVLTQVCAVFEFNAANECASWREYWDLRDIQKQIGLTEEQMAQMMGD